MTNLTEKQWNKCSDDVLNVLRKHKCTYLEAIFLLDSIKISLHYDVIDNLQK